MKVKSLLITGGTGSFGHAVLEKYLKTDIEEIRILSRDEKKQHDMRHRFNDPRIKFHIGDVRNWRSIENALDNIDLVFHAAALKQVPSCEFHPLEAIDTNVNGTSNLLEAAVKLKVRKVVVLSTDKAAYPINVMGLTKALGEKIMMNTARFCRKSDTTVCATRYGNVMASRGSVIPLFIDQIFKGDKITITNPEMTRFMMTLKEAVGLVDYAFENANNGDLFVQKAPAATVGDLASALKQIFNSNVRIEVMGPRHGEKLYETLVTKEEMCNSVDYGRYFKIPIDSRDADYESFFTKGIKEKNLKNEYNSHNTEKLKNDDLIKMLQNLPLVKKYLQK
ncbi:polysaccharide biosynthesis protein [Verrucomicrobia bacterium]|nr:polysaccharide biosynthesis protein [Verrucomicrobiota bacterium]